VAVETSTTAPTAGPDMTPIPPGGSALPATNPAALAAGVVNTDRLAANGSPVVLPTGAPATPAASDASSAGMPSIVGTFPDGLASLAGGAVQHAGTPANGVLSANGEATPEPHYVEITKDPREVPSAQSKHANVKVLHVIHRKW
jgi:hypothetical protein